MAFVDASAMIAMIAGEQEADDLANRLDRRQLRLCSALSSWKTVAGLHRSYHFASGAARATVASFMAPNGLWVVVSGATESDVALEAYAAFGEQRHPAALNLGDCFTYACARVNRMPLLFKGDEFGRTDVLAAEAISQIRRASGIP